MGESWSEVWDKLQRKNVRDETVHDVLLRGDNICPLCKGKTNRILWLTVSYSLSHYVLSIIEF